MSWLLFFNYVIIVISFGIIWKIWKLYGLVSSPAFIVLIFAFGYLTIYRVALPKFPQMTSYGIVLPFYVMTFGAFHSLYQAIHTSINEPNTECEEKTYRRKKPEWLTPGNILVWIFMISVAAILIYLELTERY